jgi:DNA polymerase
LDLETFYSKDYTLKKMSTTEYVTDERFKIHGLVYTDPKGKTDFIPESGIKKLLARIKPDDLVLAHNWAFDGFAFAKHFDWAHWNVTDTLLLANAVLGPAVDRGGSNSLGALAEELGLEAKGRLDPMEGVRDLSPEQWDYLAMYARGDARITRQIYDILQPRLSRPGLELWLMRFSLNLFINRPVSVSASHLDDAIRDCEEWKRAILSRVMEPVDISTYNRHDGLVGEYDELVGEYQEEPPLVNAEIELSSQKRFAAIIEPICRKNKVKFPTKVSDRTGKTIPALARKDEGFQALRTCGVEEIEDLVEARLVQRSAATVMARLNKLKGIQGAHMSLTFHGACTGRWTGGGNGWNPQNIPSATRAVDEESRVMAKGIRSCLRAPKDHVFVHVDAAQIEARVLGWTAGQWDIVDAFGDGADLYSEYIGDVIDEVVFKAGKDDPLYKKMTALRNVGKECILGLGYSMGWYKLRQRLKEHPQAQDIRDVLGARLNDKFVKALVDAYRSKYEHIPELWTDLDAGFHVARRGGKAEVGPIEFTCEEAFESMHIVLPSNRRIRYANFRKVKNKQGYKEWVYGRGRKIYGGLVTENVVQAMSRDHLGECIYAAEKMNYPVSLTVHDSIVSCVHKSRGKQCLDDIIGMLSEAPNWGPDLKLGAEGHISEDFN